jgi:hypothetical protein
MTKELIVTQADYELLARFILHCISGADWQVDDKAALQAFARHRLASEQACARVAEDHADQCEDTSFGRRTNITARDIAAAIRSGAVTEGDG